jgi:hypothetical protein
VRVDESGGDEGEERSEELKDLMGDEDACAYEAVFSGAIPVLEEVEDPSRFTVQPSILHVKKQQSSVHHPACKLQDESTAMIPSSFAEH